MNGSMSVSATAYVSVGEGVPNHMVVKSSSAHAANRVSQERVYPSQSCACESVDSAPPLFGYFSCSQANDGHCTKPQPAD